MVTNVIQCVSVDGQIGLVENDCVEPVHVVSIAKPTVNQTMHHLFQRRTGSVHRVDRRRRLEGCLISVVKKTTTKSKFKQLSKEMIGAPQSDLTHTFHLGVSGETFGDVTDLNVGEQTLAFVPPIPESRGSPSVRTQCWSWREELFVWRVEARTEWHTSRRGDASIHGNLSSWGGRCLHRSSDRCKWPIANDDWSERFPSFSFDSLRSISITLSPMKRQVCHGHLHRCSRWKETSFQIPIVARRPHRKSPPIDSPENSKIVCAVVIWASKASTPTIRSSIAMRVNHPRHRMSIHRSPPTPMTIGRYRVINLVHSPPTGKHRSLDSHCLLHQSCPAWGVNWPQQLWHTPSNYPCPWPPRNIEQRVDDYANLLLSLIAFFFRAFSSVCLTDVAPTENTLLLCWRLPASFFLWTVCVLIWFDFFFLSACNFHPL